MSLTGSPSSISAGMVAGPVSDFDLQVVVDYMTTGVSPRAGERQEDDRAGDDLDLRAGRDAGAGRYHAPEAVESTMAWPLPEVLADSLGEYLQAWRDRIQGGDSGVLPILAGLAIIIIIFQVRTRVPDGRQPGQPLDPSRGVRLLGLAEIFALLLSEIDLSTGFVAAVGGFIIAELIASPTTGRGGRASRPGWPPAAIGAAAGHPHHPAPAAFVRRDPGRPARLAGGADLAGRPTKAPSGRHPISNQQSVYNLVNSNLSPVASWIILVVAVGLYAAITVSRTSAAARG